MDDKISISNDVPIGFGLMLATNSKAMSSFAAMNDEEKKTVIEASRQQHTKADMARFVQGLENNFEM